MSIAFKNPQFLYFLFAIAIPIIIHLFSFRKYKKVYFHSIFLLKNIQQEQNKTRTKLKHILVLAARIFTITALVVCFAQPYIPNPNYSQKQQQTHAIAVYIDNSFSSQADSKQGNVLEYMITKARELVSGYSSVQKFYCITNSPNQLEHVQLTKEQMQNQLASITATAFTKQISDVYASVQALQKDFQIPVSLFAFSDYQRYSSDFEKIRSDSLITLNLVPFEHITSNNVYIDTCWFATPYRMHGQTEELFVRIQNNSEQVYTNLPVKLYINDSLKAIVPCNIEAFKKQDVTISFTANTLGVQALRIEIEDYPIVYDNSLYASYELASKTPILLLHEQKPNKYITTLFGNSSYFSLTIQDITRVEYSELPKYSVIVLDGLQTIPGGLAQSLQSLLQSGKTVICIPSVKSDINSYNSFFTLFGNQKFSNIDSSKTTISHVDYAHTLYKKIFSKTDKDVELPKVYTHFPFTPRQHYSVIGLQNGNPFLTHIRVDKGSLFVYTSPFSTSSNTFVSHPLFVGVYTMGMYVASQLQLYSYIGKPIRITRPSISTDPIFHIQNTQKQVDFIPQISQSAQTATISLHPMQGIQQAGHYHVKSNEKTIASIAYNYSRKESETEFYVQSDIEKIIETLQLQNTHIIPIDTKTMNETVQQVHMGVLLWRWFLLLAILFVVCEVLILRFFK